MRDLGDYVGSTMRAWGEDEPAASTGFVDEEDVPF